MEDAGVLLFFRDCNVCVVDDKNEEKKGENEQKRKDNEKRVNRSTYPRTHVRLPLERKRKFPPKKYNHENEEEKMRQHKTMKKNTKLKKKNLRKTSEAWIM